MALAVLLLIPFGDLSAADPNFAQQAYVKASNTGMSDSFGYAVDVSRDTLVVGAPYERSNATGVDGDQTDHSLDSSGAAYVFVRDGTAWSQQAYLKASNTGENDNFGFAVAISGDTIAVGAYGEASSATGIDGDQNDNMAIFSGAVYVFVRDGTSWTQQAYLKASNAETGDVFGYSVAIDVDTLVVGAMREDSAATGINGNQNDNSASNAGAAYVFVRDGTTWTQQAYLKASNAEDLDSFGGAVAISGDTVVVGAVLEGSGAPGIDADQQDNSAYGAGAVYVFTRSGTSWSQQAYIKASNPDYEDEFGGAVALSGNTLVVGATGEASKATRVNGNQQDDSADFAGAAYVFTRNGTAWSQEAYLKASNAGRDDEFGTSVAVAGATVVVGAPGESSSATGINGDQENNSAEASGAAYLFTRTGSGWSQRAYIKASNAEESDLFGNALALHGATLVSGAWFESSNATGIDGDQANNLALGSGAAYVFNDTATVQDFVMNAGLNDAWYNANTAGQGWFFVVLPDTRLFFLSVFTYDVERPAANVQAILGAPGHRWLTAFGPYGTGDTVVLDVELTEGGLFDSIEPKPVQTPGYGTLTISFINCNEAVLVYEFPSLGLSGTIELTRVAPDNVPLCEALITQ